MDIRTVEEQRNALREQNEKLQGSIKSKETIIQRLSKEEATLYERMNNYKKAFEDIFNKNAATPWEAYCEKLKEEGQDVDNIPLTEKVTFFNKTINDTRLYVLHTALQKAKKELADDTSNYTTKIEELEARVKAMTTLLALVIHKLSMKDLFPEERGASVAAIALQIEKLDTKVFSDGSDFRMSFDSQLKAPKKEDAKEPKKEEPKKEAQKQEPKKNEEPVNEPPPPEPEEEEDTGASSSEILLDAYNEFIAKNSGITTDMEDWKEKVRVSVKKHVADYIVKEKGISLPADAEKLQLWFKSVCDVVEYIGETGLSREALLKTNLTPVLDKSVLQDIFNVCVGTGVTAKIAGSAAGRGRPSPNQVLTYIGKILFHYSKLKKNEVANLRRSRTASSAGGVDEKSIQHTTLIAKTEELLESCGYGWTDEDEQKLTGSNKSTICDILASRDDVEIRIECEIGNGNIAKYKDKITKIWAIFPWALFVAPTSEAAKSMQNMFREAVGSAISAKSQGRTWTVIPFEEFKNNLTNDNKWLITKLKELEDAKKKTVGKAKVTKSEPLVGGFAGWDGTSFG